MRRWIPVATLALAFSLAGTGCSQKPAASQGLTPQQKAQLTERVNDAYVFAYPLVVMDATKAAMTAPGAAGSATVNEFAHQGALPDHTATGLASRSADTLYSSAWLDLSAEPVILTIPDTRNRYYVLSMLDGWTNVFASPGKRSGTKRGQYAIAGPGWAGELPRGVTRIDAPTAMVWVVGRIEASGENDVAAVGRIQDGLTLTPLSAWGKPGAKAAAQPATPDAAAGAAPDAVATRAPRPKTPVSEVAAMDAATFFSRVAALLPANPPAAEDAAIVATLGELGVVAGQPFAPDAKLVPTMNQAAKAALASIVAAAGGTDVDPDAEAEPEAAPDAAAGTEAKEPWIALKNPGSYATDYLQRAVNAWRGLGAGADADVLVMVTDADADGRPFNGRFNYLLHFDKAQLPPADAFWSVALYNDRQQFIENGMGRHSIGPRDKPKYNRDGSLDIHLQNSSPGGDKESNWLPTPRGAFSLNMHIHSPKQAALDGTWKPPAVTRAK